MASMVAYSVYDVVLGSRIIGGQALRGGMPRYKYIANRLLTANENLLLGIKLSEYHTGYRAFSREVLMGLPLLENSDDFVFDNQMLAQCAHFGFRIGEVSCPAKYFKEASSINFRRSVTYGFGVLWTTLQFALQRMGVWHFRIFNAKGRRLDPGCATYYARHGRRTAYASSYSFLAISPGILIANLLDNRAPSGTATIESKSIPDIRNLASLH